MARETRIERASHVSLDRAMNSQTHTDPHALIVRPANHGDEEFLPKMFVEAVLWRPEWPKVELDVLLADPRLAVYFDGWGRAGDVALVATVGDAPVGAAWFRLFTAEAPGYGFVGNDIPELGIAVVPEERSKGIGRALLRQLQIAARERGYRGLSLSVHPDNPARRVYETLGFTATNGDDSAVTMLWRAEG
jgi:GNAT superfamily N-acetyltransferase